MRFRIAAVVLLIVKGLSVPACAQGSAPGVDLAITAPRNLQSCTIVALDSVSMNFQCEARGLVRQYWVARSTRFLASRLDASFFDLAAGVPIKVTFHAAGRLLIADLVRF